MGASDLSVGSAPPVGAVDGAAWSGGRPNKRDDRLPKQKAQELDAEEEELEEAPEAGEPEHHIDFKA
jgi:hypothetical protein